MAGNGRGNGEMREREEVGRQVIGLRRADGREAKVAVSGTGERLVEH